MPFSIARNITQRFIFWLAIVIASALLLFFVIFISYDARSMEKELNVQADHLLTFTTQSLASAMWQYNQEYVNDYIESLFLYRDIVFAEASLEPRIVMTKSRHGFTRDDLGEELHGDQFIVRKSPVLYKEDRVGSIIFVMSKRRVVRQVLRNFLAVGVLFLFVATVISLAMIVLFRKNIIIPLVNLDRSARQIAGGDLDAPIDSKGEDEIAQLARTFSQMMQNIKAITASRNELNEEIEERKRAEKIIKQNLREKEVLLKEVHHRVKNNMQIIQSLLSLQADKLHEPMLKQPLLESRNRIKSMALVHETLYRSEDIAKLDVKAYFQRIADHLLRAYADPSRNIDLKIEVTPVNLGLDACIACGLILNELMSNSLKHAFTGRRRGKLAIDLVSLNDGEAQLSIQDDGRGLPPSVDLLSGETMGLRIVVILVEGQLKGTFAADNNGGTRFTISFPLLTNARTA